MRIMVWIAAAAFCFASSAQAALISVTVEVGWSGGTGTGGFEQDYTVDVERGWMNFVYDTSVADSDGSPTSGVYSGAIVAFTMSVEQQTRPDLLFTLAPGPNSLEVYPYLLEYGWEEWWNFRIRLTAQEQSGAYGYVPFEFSGYMFGDEPKSDDSIPSASSWERAIGCCNASAGDVSETDWAGGGGFRAVTLVPAPSAAALIFIGIAAFLGGGLMRQPSIAGRTRLNWERW